MVGVVGRGSGQVRLTVVSSAHSRELTAVVHEASATDTTLNTDEWNGYRPVGREEGRVHRTVDHSGPKWTWAVDLDGDGVRETHCNTQEGIWTGLRNFLRPFRGVNKWFLAQYVALFQWSHNQKQATDPFLRTLLQATSLAP